MTYEDRGVSPHKPDVKKAIAGLNNNLFPGAFCSIIKDVLGGDPERVIIMHADGSGTKASLAYLYYKETGDASIFRGIAQDSLAMNINDMIAVGTTGPFVLSNTIGRNAKLIPGVVIKEIIQGYKEQCEILDSEGIEVFMSGGETADLGDVVRTLVVDSTLVASTHRSNIIDISKLNPGAAIVGLASSGKATYEKSFNSGIGTNGFTALRHDLLKETYRTKYPESFDLGIFNIAYQGRFSVSEISDLILSPTRIYAPIIKKILKSNRGSIFGMVNNTGGGQTKCMNFGNNIHYVKSTPICPPPIFDLIRTETKAFSQIAINEMATTYNLGCLMEIYCDQNVVDDIINIAAEFNVHAQQIGETRQSKHKSELTLNLWNKSVHLIN